MEEIYGFPCTIYIKHDGEKNILDGEENVYDDEENVHDGEESVDNEELDIIRDKRTPIYVFLF